MPRPKRQGARRALIINAAGQAIRDRGLADLRIRDIAERAGLSSGSVLYYYPEIAGLMIDVHTTVVTDFYQARVARVGEPDTPAGKLRAAVGSGLPTGPDDDACRLLYELHSLADRSGTHAALMAGLFDREVTLYRSILDLGVGLGAFTLARPIEEVARNAVIIEDGYGLHMVSRNPSVTVETARRGLLGYLAAMTGAALVEPS
ncbi:TetR/AcrR family transcriptional regulator [Pseudonocardia acaciae]|uniref:TetR/AcrR family transcriptional regulator n=1 Tax=Pseudonocardia acaciae TaxID=551276 RepID=UPI0004905D6E|nr:TetR family transcriptional regulator [Pseudonocardia acaciae]